MSEKTIGVEVDKNGFSFIVLSLVSIELILRLHRCLVLAANFGQFVKQKPHINRVFIFSKISKKIRIAGTCKYDI